MAWGCEDDLGVCRCDDGLGVWRYDGYCGLQHPCES